MYEFEVDIKTVWLTILYIVHVYQDSTAVSLTVLFALFGGEGDSTAVSLTVFCVLFAGEGESCVNTLQFRNYCRRKRCSKSHYY